MTEIMGLLNLEYQLKFINTDLFSVSNSSSVLPKLINQNNKVGVLYEGNYMAQKKVGYTHGNGLNIYIAYKLQKRTVNSTDFTIQNVLFGPVKITKNVNTSHYQYHGYGICFDSGSSFCFGNRLLLKCTWLRYVF